MEPNEETAALLDAFVERDRWRAWCVHCRVFHVYRTLGLQPARCPEPTPHTSTGVLLKPAGPFTPGVEARYRREVISAARQ